jgi:hypothetical protein
VEKGLQLVLPQAHEVFPSQGDDLPEHGAYAGAPFLIHVVSNVACTAHLQTKPDIARYGRSVSITCGGF